MSKDDRWKDSKFVSAKPYFRYYCGLPLRTENEINIGALFLLDTRPRDSTNLMRLKVLYTLAHNIMVHMKTVKEAHEKQRAVHMNMCMADFISPEHRFRSRHLHPPKHPSMVDRKSRRSSRTKSGEACTPEVGHSSSTLESCSRRRSSSTPAIPEPQAQAARTVARPKPTRGRTMPKMPLEEALNMLEARDSANTSDIGTASTPDATEDGERRGRAEFRDTRSEASSPSPVKKNVTEADHQRVFDRAAYLLRQALDLEESGGGGVVLLDANANADHSLQVLHRQSSDFKEGPGGLSRQSSNELNVPVGHVTTPNQSNMAYSGTVQERVVLAAASVNYEKDRPPKNYGRADPSWKVTLTPPELARMCKKHPRGKLYNIPENVGTSLFDWEGRPITGRLSSSLFEMVLLRRQFADAKQVIFIPMFHADSNRWTCIFAFTNSRYRVFSYEMDYLPTLSFSNAIKAEFVRLATVFADKQKSNFIGSVSHELRSPLHGILASIEFLQETDCDAFQKSCITTMDACAHTLLDTVAMVLDYSKVNSMKRGTSSNSSPSASSDRQEPKMPTTTNIRNEPLFVTDEACDIAFITEEVVDGLATGHLARHRTNTGFDESMSMPDDGIIGLDSRPGMRRILNAMRPEVELILDIESPSDWTFATQPGAIRRIVMNLFGNSLKYTKHGYIGVSLRRMGLQAVGADQAVKFNDERPTIVKLTVTDTGQGISPEYLRTKIFTPFAQENAKAAGAGLGLSIVRSIIGMLQGEIDIKSIVNVGTMITVTLPMKKASPDAASRNASPAPNALAPGVHTRPKDMSISGLQSLQIAPQTAIYEPALELDSFGQTQGAVHIHAALVQYLQNWFGFPTMKTWDFDFPSTILIVDEIHLPTLLARKSDYLERLSRQCIILLCANPGRQAVLSKDIASGQVELVCKPFGPYKLARALCRALEKAAMPIKPEYVEVLDPPSNASTPTNRSARSIHSTRSSSPSSNASSGSAARIRHEENHKRPLLPAKDTSSSSTTSFYSPPATRGSGTASGSQHAGEVSATSDGGFPFDRKKGPPSVPPPASSMPVDPLDPIPPSPLSEPGSPLSPGTIIPTEPRSHLQPNTSEHKRPPGPSRTISKKSVRVPGPAPNHDASSSSGGLRVIGLGDTHEIRTPRLLLVDDNRLNLDLLHTFVKKRGFGNDNCATAEDGMQAVSAFQTFAPDIIFMDLSMPVMDGLEATRNIRRIEEGRRASAIEAAESADEQGDSPGSPGIPGSPGHERRRSSVIDRPALVVALTGNAKGSDQTEAYNSGIDIYMTKPVSFKQVGKLLENWRESQKEG